MHDVSVRNERGQKNAGQVEATRKREKGDWKRIIEKGLKLKIETRKNKRLRNKKVNDRKVSHVRINSLLGTGRVVLDHII